MLFCESRMFVKESPDRKKQQQQQQKQKAITIRYPHLHQFGSLGIHLWSDGCSAQFRSRFVFQLTKFFPSRINVIRYFNERHHEKDPMDVIGGCIKNAVSRAVMAEKFLCTHH